MHTISWRLAVGGPLGLSLRVVLSKNQKKYRPLRTPVVCDMLWCVVLCGGGSVLRSHDVPCGVVWCHVVWCGVVRWGIVRYGCLCGLLNGVLVA